MAKFTTAAGIEDLTGKLNTKDSIVMRQKTYRLSGVRIPHSPQSEELGKLDD